MVRRRAFLTLTGGSLGLQIGGQAVDLVLVVVDQRGLEQLLKNQFKIGGDASVAAGPVGRDAEASTDIQMRAKILSYSRTRGLFAGITLKGSTIRQDRDANERFYGRAYRSTELVHRPPRRRPRPRPRLARRTRPRHPVAALPSTGRASPTFGVGPQSGQQSGNYCHLGVGRKFRAAALGGVSRFGTRLATFGRYKRQLYGVK